MLLRVFPAWLASLLLFSGTAAAASNCPQGQYPICLGSCFCVEDPNQVIGPAYESATLMAASTLEEQLRQSRDRAIQAGTNPMPAAIRQQLLPYYDSQLLDMARYRVGNGEELDLAGTMLQNPDIQAVTLIDIVIFRSEQDAQDNLALWAHELWHVQQYRDWGVHDFALRYTRDFNAVETPAYQIQARVRTAARQQLGAQTAP
ncbi:MAG TPA: DUF4157 domain-containing protein [Pseudomonas sp.]|nr:DUF4157 domain-containing protein [Pseudomonas sp.]